MVHGRSEGVMCARQHTIVAMARVGAAFLVASIVVATLGVLATFAFITPGLDHCAAPNGSAVLVLADTHFQTLLPLNTINMRRVVDAARAKWTVHAAIVLGDVMHGGGGSTGGNVSDSEFSALASNAKDTMGGLDTVWVPGNHDLRGFPTHRWHREFGRYNHHHDLAGIAVYAASAYDLKTPTRDCLVYAAHVWAADTPVCNGTRAIITGHKHHARVDARTTLVHTTVPTINPWQALSNNNFDGSGEQGFALLGNDGGVHVCIVEWFTPIAIVLYAALACAALASGFAAGAAARPRPTHKPSRNGPRWTRL